jgi:hypothetical protein
LRESIGDRRIKEGWWLNWRNPSKLFYVDDHEMWIRQENNARQLGVPGSVIGDFSKFEVRKDRETFLLHIMRHAPVMRVRGHGVDTTFEYFAHERQDPMWAVYTFAKRQAGPYSWLNISNMATNEYTSITWKDFQEVMDAGGPDAVMRAASQKFTAEGCKMIRELLRVAEEISGRR